MVAGMFICYKLNFFVAKVYPKGCFDRIKVECGEKSVL